MRLERLAETSVDGGGVQLVDVDIVRIKSAEKSKKSGDREKSKHDHSSRSLKTSAEKTQKKESSGCAIFFSDYSVRARL